jgi:hypothetical protein
MFSKGNSKPDWFYRVSQLALDRQVNYWDDDVEINPEDYDEDLSDCSTYSFASRNGCEYDSLDECPYHRALD